MTTSIPGPLPWLLGSCPRAYSTMYFQADSIRNTREPFSLSKASKIESNGLKLSEESLAKFSWFDQPKYSNRTSQRFDGIIVVYLS